MLYLFGQGERADYFRHLKYLQEHEKLLSDLSETELNTLCFEVDYCVEKQQYKVCEYDIVIEDSDTFVRRTVLKEKIQKIYEDSHQNYGAPKITAELRKSGECISEKTVGNYMRQSPIGKTIYSHCGYLSPTEYEEQYLEKLQKNAVKIAS